MTTSALTTTEREPDFDIPELVFWEETTLADIEEHAGPWETWAQQCHAVSLAIVKSGLLIDSARVARGTALGVRGQHSWIVLGDDVYANDADILDPTLWSYDGARSPLLLRTNASRGTHRPHGLGSIFAVGKPASTGGEPIELSGLSQDAQSFLDILGPLDIRGWMQLLHSPVQGWPAKEIITAAYADKRLCALIPIDIVGLVTDLNPEGLYR